MPAQQLPALAAALARRAGVTSAPGERVAEGTARFAARYIQAVACTTVRRGGIPVSTTWCPSTSVIRTLIRRPAAPPASPRLPGPAGRAAHGGCDPARRPARGVPRVQRPGPVAVGARDQSLPPAARPAGRHRRQPVAVVEDLHGQGAGGPGRGDPQLQRPRQRRVHGGLVAHRDRAGPRVGDPGEGRPAQVDRGCRAVRAHVHDFGPHRARRPGDIHVAAAGPAGRVAARRQAGVPAPGRERAQPAAARRVAGIVEHGMTLDRGSGQRGPGWPAGLASHGPGRQRWTQPPPSAPPRPRPRCPGRRGPARARSGPPAARSGPARPRGSRAAASRQLHRNEDHHQDRDDGCDEPDAVAVPGLPGARVPVTGVS